MRVSEVSKRYAKALLAAAKSKNADAKIASELIAVSKIVNADAQVKQFFANPGLTADQKLAVIKTAFESKGLSEEVYNFLLLLAEKSRLSIIGEVTEAYQALVDLEQGITRGVVKSARPVDAAVKAELESKIEKVLKKKIVLTFQEDPKLLGGMVAHVGGWTFDDSIETHLKKINEELNRRAN